MVVCRRVFRQCVMLMARFTYPALLAACAILIGTGCATTTPLDSARREFGSGNLDAAEKLLADDNAHQNKVLLRMERGMIRHLRHDYTNSTADWLEAVRLERDLEVHSASKAGASMVVNDSVLNFRGYPYERTYLHVYLAKNYLARGLWEDAGVEGRSIALRMHDLDGFPDDAYSHYMAALCLELCGDDSNAALQYRLAAKLAPDAGIEETTGRFKPANAGTNTPPKVPFTGNELVCLLDFDGQNGMMPDHADIYADGKRLGSSKTLTDGGLLQMESASRMATRHTTKPISRIALMGTIASIVGSQNKDLGNLLWLLLFATETEDTRRWETLPGRLAVVRVPCPATLTQFEVEFKGYGGSTLRRVTVKEPLGKRGRLFVSFCRDYP